MAAHRNVVLRTRPQGRPKPDDFELVTSPIPKPEDGQMLVRVHYCSLDPAMRRWMDEDSYAVVIGLDETLPSLVVGRIVESRADGFAPGDWVTGLGRVADYAVMLPGGFTRRVDPSTVPSPTSFLSILGPNAVTAYNGLIRVGEPRPGETVLVSGAAGSVGSVVGQIARIEGCRAVGIAGGPEKCDRLVEEFGYDAAVDYKGKDLASLTDAIRRAAADGVDVYFDNVGGLPLDAALANINQNARLVICGMISRYNETEPEPGPRNIWQIVARTATMRGFLNRQFADDFDDVLEQLSAWVQTGKLHWREHVDRGIENFYVSFMRLFDGTNQGKLILEIAEPDAPAASDPS